MVYQQVKITKQFIWVADEAVATLRLQYDDDYEYEFAVLSTRFRFGGRKFSKCACSELKTRSRSRPRTPIWRSLAGLKRVDTREFEVILTRSYRLQRNKGRNLGTLYLSKNSLGVYNHIACHIFNPHIIAIFPTNYRQAANCRPTVGATNCAI